MLPPASQLCRLDVMAHLLQRVDRVPNPFHIALRDLIEASVEQQLDRPELARFLDFVEAQAAFHDLSIEKPTVH
jgi:hypothetical protein